MLKDDEFSLVSFAHGFNVSTMKPLSSPELGDFSVRF
jgi:hypothetical protein